MGTVEPLRKPSPRSPERENLAAAIVRHRSAIDRLARIKDVSEVLIVFDAQEKVERAEQTLAEARKRESKLLVSQLLGDQTDAGPSVASAEFLLEDARDDLARAHRTRDALDDQQRVAEAEVERAQRAVRDAVRKVVEAEGAPEKLLAQFHAARQEVSRLYEVLSLLSARNCLPPYWDAISASPSTNADARWRDALAALEGDADAALPPP